MKLYYKVQGKSMEPWCREGDFAVRNPFGFLFSSLKEGDLALVRHPKKDILLLKRIKSFKKEGEREYAWVQGDNPPHSSDSRDFGWVERKRILGKAFILRKT